MSNLIGWLIDLEYEQRAAYQERELTSGAQNPIEDAQDAQQAQGA